MKINTNPKIYIGMLAIIVVLCPILSDNLPTRGMGRNCITLPNVTKAPVINSEFVMSSRNGWYTTLNILAPNPWISLAMHSAKIFLLLTLVFPLEVLNSFKDNH